MIGVLSAGIGGELFVRGIVGLAHWARVSAGIIGATVAAFATSSPELSVAVNSALDRKPQISLGDVLGSNIVNVALILGLALIISGIRCPRDSVKRDFPIALLVPVIIGILSLDGLLSRIDGFMLLGMFFAWIIAVMIEVRRQQSAAEEVLGERRGWLAIILCVTGLVFFSHLSQLARSLSSSSFWFCDSGTHLPKKKRFDRAQAWNIIACTLHRLYCYNSLAIAVAILQKRRSPVPNP
jgi:cation:H+ antiporter